MFGGSIFLDDESGASFNNIHISNCVAGYGGAILILGTSRDILTNCVIINNLANFHGGGIAINQQAATIFENITIQYNTAQGQGGGIDVSGTATVVFVNTVVSNNYAIRAGGVYCGQSSQPTFYQTNFTSNVAVEFGGGGLIADFSAPNLTEVYISNNNASDEGGGFLTVGYASPYFNNCQFIANNGYHGGGLSLNSNPADSAFITIENCLFTNNVAKTRGGAIKISGSSQPLIRDSLIDTNYAVDGGGIGITDDGAPNVVNTTIQNNVALIEGGGVLSIDWSTPTFSNCTIVNNRVATGTGGGVAVADFSSPSFLDSVFMNNSAAHGAGLYSISAAAITIASTQFLNNWASINGGGISIHGISNLTVSDTVFYNNSVTSLGGAIICEDVSLLVLTNCNFTANLSAHSGGALAILGHATTYIDQCNFENNLAIRGGAIYVTSRELVPIISTTIQNNQAILGGAMYVGSFTQLLVNGLEIYRNVGYFGGGVIMEATNIHTSIQYAHIHGNYAVQGGGLYILPLITRTHFPVNEQINLLLSQYHGSSDSTILFTNLLFSTYFNGLSPVDVFTEDVLTSPDLYLPISNAAMDATTEQLHEVIHRLGAFAYFPDYDATEEVLFYPAFQEFMYHEVLDEEVGNYTFTNTIVEQNTALIGGGISIFLSYDIFYITFGSNCTFTNNFAYQYGGGLFFQSFKSNFTLMYSVLFEDNHADYAGGSVAWGALDSKEVDFCAECQFMHNTGGYQTANGFATPPIMIALLLPCPQNLELVEDGFNTQVVLQDAFGNQVQGSILSNNEFVVSLSSPSSTCQITSTSNLSLTFPTSGVASFGDVSLQGIFFLLILFYFYFYFYFYII